MLVQKKNILRICNADDAAVQTFLVQHVGSGTYLPTMRAVSGKSYGAIPASTPVGPEGGKELVEETIKAIKELWPEAEKK